MTSIVTYIREVVAEAKKVSWPSREHTVEKTLLVITVSIIVGLYIGAIDFIFQKLITMLV